MTQLQTKLISFMFSWSQEFGPFSINQRLDIIHRVKDTLKKEVKDTLKTKYFELEYAIMDLKPPNLDNGARPKK